MSRTGDVVRKIEELAREHAEGLRSHFREESRPHVARVLADAAVVATRAAAGEDVTTATMALEVSAAAIAREEMAIVTLEGRTLALRAALAVIGGLLGA